MPSLDWALIAILVLETAALVWLAVDRRRVHAPATAPAPDAAPASDTHLSESAAIYQSVVEYQTDLICRYLPDTTLTFVNDAYSRFWGKTRDELIGTKFLTFIPESAHPRCCPGRPQSSRTPSVQSHEHEVVLSDGTIGWQHWINRPIVDADGNVTELQAIGRDITDRRRAEEELRNALADVKRLSEQLHAENLYLHDELTAAERQGDLVVPQRDDAREAGRGGTRGADDDAGADHRRDRHRQGGAGARAALDERPPRSAVRAGQLRRAAGEPDRERAVRPRARRLHRRGVAARRAVRAGRRRHALPRRDRRAADRAPAEAAARAAGKRVRAGGRQPHRARLGPHPRGDQSRPRRRGRRRDVPRRSLLPAQRLPDSRAAAPRARRGHRPAGEHVPEAGLPPRRTGDRRHLARDARGVRGLRLARQRARAAERHRAGHGDDSTAMCSDCQTTGPARWRSTRSARRPCRRPEPTARSRTSARSNVSTS